ncbi:hypothetical protein BDV25DRAFT_152511 [Aspergillus avenaceus]|uniref:N-acetyltransferase domain-containing protein n=1 Tax=Aspergillus avenaceus TaxID=36643 RepID=A0A5N6TYV1_ASPAV|nr:hypothetical protein BDV25DRAFT_152511 [Aspergillus avenaceus]
MNSQIESTSPQGKEKTFFTRPMEMKDIPQAARLAATEYTGTELSTWLCPRHQEYPDDFYRRFVRMLKERYINPRSLGFVTVPASNPQTPVAYALFMRLGDDDIAKRYIATRSSWWRTLQSLWFSCWTWIESFIWRDRITDNDALATFEKSEKADQMRYWDSPEMKAKYGSRWHTLSVVVSSACQRRGLGKHLMNEVLRRAEDEGVVVGLEASKDGEKLYQSLGFELRGRFGLSLKRPVGGIMMWTPKTLHSCEFLN